MCFSSYQGAGERALERGDCRRSRGTDGEDDLQGIKSTLTDD